MGDPTSEHPEGDAGPFAATGSSSPRDWAALADAALLELTVAGEGEAFAEFYRRHLAVVVAYLRKRTPGPDAAADLAAETFMSALQSLRSGRTVPPSPLGWLMTIAHHKLIDSWRRGRVEAETRRQLGLEPLVLDDAALARVEEMASGTDVALELAKQLPADQFEALEARVLQERDYGEIAARLDLSEAVVRKRVSRALSFLRSAMRER
jgi:RNA polymerase sigma-70 factor (ECF subfamily)